MKLAIFNGSPRYKNSNSKVLIEYFLTGYNKVSSEDIPTYYIAPRKKKNETLEAYQKAETVILIFPLYTDSMPGIVKEFFENIAKLKSENPKKIGFIVQSGFPESIHSIYLERYLKKLVKRLNYEYLGTIIKGGVEGIRMMPAWMTKKLFIKFENLGEYFAKNEAFCPKTMAELRKPINTPAIQRFIYSAISKTGLTNFYWNNNLKENNAYDNRFDKPYA